MDLVEAAEAVSMEEAALSVGGASMGTYVVVGEQGVGRGRDRSRAEYAGRFQVGGSRTAARWWWQKHSWNEWRQVVTAGKAVAATEEAVVDEAAETAGDGAAKT